VKPKCGGRHWQRISLFPSLTETFLNCPLIKVHSDCFPSSPDPIFFKIHYGREGCLEEGGRLGVPNSNPAPIIHGQIPSNRVGME